MHRLAAVLAMLLLSGVVAAEDPAQSLASDPRVEDAVAAWEVWVENDLGESGVPATSYAFVHRDQLLASGGIGLADPATSEPADADTLYSICSISKLFTSIAVMQLRDMGELDLDDDLGVYVPWFGSLKDAHPDDESISIRRALTHSAGLPRESDSPYWSGPDFDFPTTAQIRERLDSQQTLYPSGRYFQYSNLGMALLGEVVAARAGRPWSDVVQDDILVPLGMNDTFTSVPEAYATGRLAAGFSARRGPRIANGWGSSTWRASGRPQAWPRRLPICRLSPAGSFACVPTPATRYCVRPRCGRCSGSIGSTPTGRRPGAWAFRWSSRTSRRG